MQGYMPVFLQSPRPGEQTARQPASALQQPAATEPVPRDEVKDAKTNVEKYKKRVRCTSIVLKLIGFIGVGISSYHYINARHDAKKTMQYAGIQEPRPDDVETNYITRDEFNLFDTFKTMALIHIFFYGIFMCMGMSAKCTLWCNKSWWTKRCLKKSAVGVVLIIILSVLASKQQNYVNHITDGDKKSPQVHFKMEFHFRGGRHLEANSTDQPKLNSSQEEEEPEMPAPPAEHEDYEGRTIFGLQGQHEDYEGRTIFGIQGPHQHHQGRSRFAPEYQDMISGGERSHFGPHGPHGERGEFHMDKHGRQGHHGRPNVQSDQYPEDEHDQQRHHKKGKGHCKKYASFLKILRLARVLLLGFIGTHFYFLFKLKSAQEKQEAVVAAKKEQPVVSIVSEQPVIQQQQQAVYFSQPVIGGHSQVYTEAPTIQDEDDKHEDPVVVNFVPQQSSTIIFKNDMV